MRGTDVAMVFQEPSTALNPVYTVGWQIAEGLRAHGDLSKKEARAKAIEILGRVGIPDPERAGRPLPAPVLGRAEAAHRHRDGARARPRADRRRRADDRPRRDRAGRDPRPAAPTAATSSAPRSCSSRTTWASSPTSPTAWRSCTRARSSSRPTCSTLFAAPQARLHQGAAGGRAVRRSRHRPSAPSVRRPGRRTGRISRRSSRPRASRSCIRVGFGRAGVPRGRRRRLRDPARRGARPRRRVRFGQDHHRPRDRRAHQGHRRLAEGARTPR